MEDLHTISTPDVYYVREAASLVGVCAATLRRWDKEGHVRPSVRGPRGTRLYSAGDIDRARDYKDRER